MQLPAAELQRRAMLRLALGVVASSFLPLGAQARRRWPFDPFGLGVASGSPTHDSVVLWTRLVPPGRTGSLGHEPVALRWEIAHDEAFSRLVRRGEALATPQLAHSVHAEAAGLAPDRWYFYRFIAGDAVSPTGRTRTLPAPDAAVARLRLAYASCQRWEHGHYAAYRHMREEQPDLVMFLGDYIYEYASAGKAVRQLPVTGAARSLSEYRDWHALYRGDGDLQAMHAACPWLVTWDDHEVENDYAGVHGGEQDFAARRNAAYQAFYEHMPLRASVFARALAGVEVKLASRLHYGRLADLLLLDTRQYRDLQACSPGKRRSGVVDAATCAALQDPSRSLLGTAQEAWLDAKLAEARRGWTVIGQQTLFGRRAAVQASTPGVWNDGWDGYPAARSRLVGSLQRHGVANPVLLGGDVHENWVGQVKADYLDAASANVGVEFCGTSISSRSGTARDAALRLAENPHFVFADGNRRGYGVCEITPARMTTSLRVVDDATRADAQIETLARFVVEAGRPTVQRD